MTKPPPRTTPDLTGLLDTAAYVLNQRLGEALSTIGLTQRMQCVLIHALEEERSQIELAQLARMDKTTMVATMDRLEELGYAERRQSPTDRRTRIIEVTPAGAKMAVQGQAVVDRVHEEALSEIPASERTAAVRMLERLIDGAADRPAVAASSVRRRRQSSQAAFGGQERVYKQIVRK
jgi:MarR family transcriptional regulator for hemolysin